MLDSQQKEISDNKLKSCMNNLAKIQLNKYKIISPSGEIFYTNSLPNFCKRFSVISNCNIAKKFREIAKGNKNNYNNWTCEYDLS